MTLPRIGGFSLSAISCHSLATGLFKYDAQAMASSKTTLDATIVNAGLFEGLSRSAIPIEPTMRGPPEVGVMRLKIHSATPFNTGQALSCIKSTRPVTAENS